MWWGILKKTIKKEGVERYHPLNPKGFIPFCGRILPKTRRTCNIEKEKYFSIAESYKDYCEACRQNTKTSFAPPNAVKPRWSETSRNPNSVAGRREAEKRRKDKEYGSLRRFDTGER